MTILFLSIEFNYCCGISRSIFSLSRELKKKGHRVILGCPAGTMINDYISSELEYIYTPIYPDNKKIKDAWQSINIIRNTVSIHKVDIIHSHHRLAELYALIAGCFKSIPTVSTVHAILSGKKSLSFRSGKLIAVSNVVKEMLISDFKVKEKKINVIRNIPRKLTRPSASDLARFKEKAGIAENDFVVAALGRLHPEKGFDVFLKAIKDLAHLNIKSILVGKGILKNDFERYAWENKINITFIEETDEVELIYESAHVIVIPSRQESAGLVALEAGFFKKAVIASYVGGLKETIKNGITGFSITPESSTAITEAIIHLYNNKHLSQLLGSQLFDHIVKEYTVSKIVDQTESVYKQLMQ